MLTQLEHRKEQYETLKGLSTTEIAELYTYENFKGLAAKWKKSLDMVFPPGHAPDPALLDKFQQSKKAEMVRINGFLNDFTEWH